MKKCTAPGLCLLSCLLAGLLVLSGCSGAGSRPLTETDLAELYLPTTRTLEHHPDSLVHLAVSIRDGQVTVALTEPIDRLQRIWSAGYLGVRGGRAFETDGYQTFATLRSLELTLAELAYETGLPDLSRDVAERLIAERRDLYQTYLIIDVYVFISERYASAPSGTSLRALRADVTLTDDRERTFAPARVETYPPVLSQRLAGQPGAYHRRNTLYFERDVDGRDLLQDVESLQLSLRTSQPFPALLYFGWKFEGGS